MLSTCNNALHMSKMIQIRNVPDDVHRKLKVRAAQEGTTLSDFLLAEISAAAEQPSMTELLERLASQPPFDTEVSSAELIRRDRDSR
jgi:plasmid stability protein